MMNKGLAIVEVNDSGTQSVFVDQEILECARLNMRTKKRVSAAQREHEKKARAMRKSEVAAAKRKAYAVSTALHVLIRCAILGGSVWGCVAGLIHPVIAVPVGILCLCGACLRLGAWLGSRRQSVNERQRTQSVIRDASPCKDCTERFTACSDKCPKDARGDYGYKAWKAEIERVKKVREEYLRQCSVRRKTHCDYRGRKNDD